MTRTGVVLRHRARVRTLHYARGTNQSGLGGAGNTVTRGLTASKERLMPDSISRPADERKIGETREPVRLGDALPDVLREIARRQLERVG